MNPYRYLELTRGREFRWPEAGAIATSQRFKMSNCEKKFMIVFVYLGRYLNFVWQINTTTSSDSPSTGRRPAVGSRQIATKPDWFS